MPTTLDHPETSFSSNRKSEIENRKSLFSPAPSQIPAILDHLDSPATSLYQVAQANNTTIDALSAWMTSPEVRARQELINSAAAQRNHDLALRAQRRSIAVITQILDRAQEEEAEHAFSNEPKPTLARTRRREVIAKLTRVLLQLEVRQSERLEGLERSRRRPACARTQAAPLNAGSLDRAADPQLNSAPAPDASSAIPSSGAVRPNATADDTPPVRVPRRSMRASDLFRRLGLQLRTTNSRPATHVPSAPQHVQSPAQLVCPALKRAHDNHVDMPRTVLNRGWRSGRHPSRRLRRQRDHRRVLVELFHHAPDRARHRRLPLALHARRHRPGRARLSPRLLCRECPFNTARTITRTE